MDLSGRVMHTMLRVADMERTLDFYCGLLGMAVQMSREDPDGYRNVFVGYGPVRAGAGLEFASRPGVTAYTKGDGFDHIAIEVADAAAATEYLRGYGVAVLREVKTAASGARIAIVADPDGYKIELVQPKPPDKAAAG